MSNPKPEIKQMWKMRNGRKIYLYDENRMELVGYDASGDDFLFNKDGWSKDDRKFDLVEYIEPMNFEVGKTYLRRDGEKVVYEKNLGKEYDFPHHFRGKGIEDTVDNYGFSGTFRMTNDEDILHEVATIEQPTISIGEIWEDEDGSWIRIQKKENCISGRNVETKEIRVYGLDGVGWVPNTPNLKEKVPMIQWGSKGEEYLLRNGQVAKFLGINTNNLRAIMQVEEGPFSVDVYGRVLDVGQSPHDVMKKQTKQAKEQLQELMTLEKWLEFAKFLPTGALFGGAVRDMLRNEPPVDFDIAAPIVDFLIAVQKMGWCVESYEQMNPDAPYSKFKQMRFYVATGPHREDGERLEFEILDTEVTTGTTEEILKKQDFDVNSLFLFSDGRVIEKYSKGEFGPIQATTLKGLLTKEATMILPTPKRVEKMKQKGWKIKCRKSTT